MFPVSVTLDGSRYELLTLAPEKMTPVNPFRKIREDRVKALEEKRKEAEQKRAQEQDEEQDGAQKQKSSGSQSMLMLPMSGVLAAALLLSRTGKSERGNLLEIEEKNWDFQEANRFPGLYPFRESQEEVCMIEYERATGERFPTVDAVLWKTLCLPSAIVGDVILLPGEIVIFGGTTFLIYAIVKGIQEKGSPLQ